jgi:hypothetical protein
MSGLTYKQAQLLAFLRAREETGVCPSFREMREHLGLAANSGVHRLVVALEERGFIERLYNRARSIRVLRDPEPYGLQAGSLRSFGQTCRHAAGSLKIYFIQQEDRGPVKIGFGEPAGRLSELQCGNPQTLYLRATCGGGRSEERRLHKALESYRVRGEWFDWVYPIPELVAKIASGDLGAFSGAEWAREKIAAAERHFTESGRTRRAIDLIPIIAEAEKARAA